MSGKKVKIWSIGEETNKKNKLSISGCSSFRIKILFECILSIIKGKTSEYKLKFCLLPENEVLMRNQSNK